MTKIASEKYFFNREISLLQFNLRVLAQAEDKHLPLLERLKFLCICSANLDEFFEIRVASLQQKAALPNAPLTDDGLTQVELLKRIRQIAMQLVAKQYEILNQQLFPALKKSGISFIQPKHWSAKQREWLSDYFQQKVLPVLSPIAIDPAHPMPRLVNKSLNFLVELSGKDAFGRESHVAVIHAPRILPRIIELPRNSKKQYHLVFLSDLIYAFIKQLFPGLMVKGCYQFRITRNSDLLLAEDETKDLATTLRNKLQALRYGAAVRLEISADCPEEFIDFLLEKHQLTQRECYPVAGPVNLSRYSQLYDLINRTDLKFSNFTPQIPKRLRIMPNIFAALQKGDIILHHPYESFLPVVNFIQQATTDPNVIAIKQTLYRTGPESVIVRVLIEAARAGKEVTAVIELRARFDEESNLTLANRLQEAGVLVVYGVVGYKTHAKLLLIVRRENDQLQRYCHLGTGNYHANTTKNYTDYGLLTCNPVIGQDVQNVFQQLTGMGKTVHLACLWQAPFTLYKKLIALIDREITHAYNNKKAYIIIKVNALTDSHVIKHLYKASQAGVKIDLIVRGICCLKPQVQGLSENITVRSVIGRFLEHERVYYFYNNSKEEIYCASADLMERNLHHRVEVCFPIEDKKIAKRIKKESLFAYLAKNITHWVLQADGEYKYLGRRWRRINVQDKLLKKFKE